MGMGADEETRTEMLKWSNQSMYSEETFKRKETVLFEIQMEFN